MNCEFPARNGPCTHKYVNAISSRDPFSRGSAGEIYPVLIVARRIARGDDPTIGLYSGNSDRDKGGCSQKKRPMLEMFVNLVIWVVCLAILWCALMVTYVIAGKLIAWTVMGILGAVDMIRGGPRHIAESVAQGSTRAWNAIVGLVLSVLARLLRPTRRNPL